LGVVNGLENPKLTGRTASNICQESVLRHWACAKIVSSSDVPEEVILETIVSKLRTVRTMSYAQIADTAHKMGRTQLAAMLLDHEPKAAEQVTLPLFLSLWSG
jgi:hypothetical protein